MYNADTIERRLGTTLYGEREVRLRTVELAESETMWRGRNEKR